MIINIDSLSNEKIIVELINQKGEVVIDSVSYAQQMIFNKLAPGSYRLRFIFDRDGNGKWTSGSLSTGIIPEDVIYYPGEIKAKSKWDIEIDWEVDYKQ